ncbi:hypothetical protein M9194_01165 [Vibrio sp. S4M6]|uniref:hypothetical protein n=1 Tax=Vibrio sinus TaxID=2946865 RepID=UPI00202A141B|nr:hypothetical protein [Vibrio sinus]MCL9780039.1 hypothetical protein [Vibrio sinus]
MPTPQSVEMSDFSSRRRRKFAMYEEDTTLFQDLNPLYKDLLDVFSKASIEKSIGTKLKVVAQGASTANTVKSSIQTTAKYVRTQHSKSHGSDSQDSASEQISSQVVDNLKQHAMSKRKGLSKHLKSSISEQLASKQQELYGLVPHIVKTIISELNPVTKELNEARKAAISALKSVKLLSDTSGLSKIGTTRSASLIIERVRSEVKSVALKQSGLLVLNAGLITIKVISLGVGTVVTTIVNAVMAVFNFLKGVYDRWLTELKYICFQDQCRNMLLKADTLTDKQFESWFSNQMAEIPVIACYMMCMPRFSSPYDFLKITDSTPPPKTLGIIVSRCLKRRYHNMFKSGEFDGYKTSHQKSLYSAYTSLQAQAKEFVKEAVIKLTSTDTAVNKLLRAAQGEINYIPGCNSQMIKSALIKNRQKQLGKYGGYAAGRLEALYYTREL